MNKTEFIFELVRAGYSKEQCCRIDEIVESVSDCTPYANHELRWAAHQYLLICTDINKLRGFLLLADEMNRGYAVSWENATQFVLKVVCGWCH